MGSHVLGRREASEGNKQVRVDNWGVFFLQRLQTFFNNTDYCDLTLQFGTNYQLKVHRLVLNACTEYFQELEQTCDKVDDVLMMPPDLQADVVLPIINFMYTGMLEFHTSIFEKLHETASLMNITVLTKLLDAQKVPSPYSNKQTKKNSNTTWHSASKRMLNKNVDPELPAPLPGRKLPVWKRKSAPIPVPHTVIPHFYQEQKRSAAIDPLMGVDNAPKPTRFEWPEEDLSSFNLFDSSFNEISYTSKPLTTQYDEPRASTSFDRIRDSPDVNHLRSSRNYNNLDVDLNDVRDYVKEQRIRSSINMNEDDDDMDNDFDSPRSDTLKRKGKFVEDGNAKRVRFNTSEKENHAKESKINITTSGKTSSEDHKKLISEVLKKYPNLVKKNKSIRLKILTKSNNEPTSTEDPKRTTFKKATKSDSGKLSKTAFIEDKGDDEGPWRCARCSTQEEPVEFVLYYLYRKHMTDFHNERCDSRMCKYCGHKSINNNMLLYHQYTRHCIKPPSTHNFPKCPRCPFIAFSDILLTRHQLNHTKYESQCPECQITFCSEQMLTAHLQITGHNGKSIRSTFDCQYCSKRFPVGSNLFVHIRQQHRDDARRDGIVSLDEMDEDQIDSIENEQSTVIKHSQVQYLSTDKREKVKILQDVKIPSDVAMQHENSHTLTLEPSSESESLSNVASGIATSLSLVDVVVLDENQQYILHTNNQQEIASGESEYIIPEIQDETYTTTQQHSNVLTQSMLHGANIGSTDELVMVLTDHDYGDESNNEIINNENSNIVVLYSHPIDGQENQFITSQGNLMLTSQAGLIELRNGSTVVTSNNSHFLTTTTDSQDNSQIESIEMIQREINQHPDMKERLNMIQNKTIEVHSSEIIQNEEVSLLSQDTTRIKKSKHENTQLEEQIAHVETLVEVCEATETEIEGCETNEVVTEVCETNESQTEICETNEAEAEGCETNEAETEGCETIETEEEGCETNEAETEGCETNEVQTEVCETNETQTEGCETNEAEAEGCKTNKTEVKGCEAKEAEQESSKLNKTEADCCETNEPEAEGCETNEPEVEGCETNEPEAAGCETNETETEICGTNVIEVFVTNEIETEIQKANEVEEEVLQNNSNDLQEVSKENLVNEEPNKSVEGEAIEPVEHSDVEVDCETAPCVTVSNDEKEEPMEQDLPNEDKEESMEQDVSIEEKEELMEQEVSNEEKKEQMNRDVSVQGEEMESVVLENSNIEVDSLTECKSVEIEAKESVAGNSSKENTETESCVENIEQVQETERPAKVIDEENNQKEVIYEVNVQEIAPDDTDTVEDERTTVIQNNNNQVNAAIEEQDETSNSSIKIDSVAESCENVPKVTSLPKKTNESAKVILEDWGEEDTDSQQSDSKSGTNVNKLIDDWDDDEDENKKV